MRALKSGLTLTRKLRRKFEESKEMVKSEYLQNVEAVRKYDREKGQSQNSESLPIFRKSGTVMNIFISNTSHLS